MTNLREKKSHITRHKPIKHTVKSHRKSNGKFVRQYSRGDGSRKTLTLNKNKLVLGGRTFLGSPKSTEGKSIPLFLRNEISYVNLTPLEEELYSRLPIESIHDKDLEEEAMKREVQQMKIIGGKLDLSKVKKSALFSKVQNRENWKIPTRPIRVRDEEDAKELSDALSYFLGGSEVSVLPNKTYIVRSKGYYHYIGS
jgi:hypothetical protein